MGARDLHAIRRSASASWPGRFRRGGIIGLPPAPCMPSGSYGVLLLADRERAAGDSGCGSFSASRAVPDQNCASATSLPPLIVRRSNSLREDAPDVNGPDLRIARATSWAFRTRSIRRSARQSRRATAACISGDGERSRFRRRSNPSRPLRSVAAFSAGPKSWGRDKPVVSGALTLTLPSPRRNRSPRPAVKEESTDSFYVMAMTRSGCERGLRVTRSQMLRRLTNRTEATHRTQRR